MDYIQVELTSYNMRQKGEFLSYIPNEKHPPPIWIEVRRFPVLVWNESISDITFEFCFSLSETWQISGHHACVAITDKGWLTLKTLN